MYWIKLKWFKLVQVWVKVNNNTVNKVTQNKQCLKYDIGLKLIFVVNTFKMFLLTF